MARPALKADFIRSHPRDLPLSELQRLAKRAGHGHIGSSYVSKIRGKMPKRRNGHNGLGHHHIAPAPAMPAPAPPPTEGASDVAVEIDLDTGSRTVTDMRSEVRPPEMTPHVRAFLLSAISIGPKRAQALLDALKPYYDPTDRKD
jgi:hypothetical protein